MLSWRDHHCRLVQLNKVLCPAQLCQELTDHNKFQSWTWIREVVKFSRPPVLSALLPVITYEISDLLICNRLLFVSSVAIAPGDWWLVRGPMTFYAPLLERTCGLLFFLFLRISCGDVWKYWMVSNYHLLNFYVFRQDYHDADPLLGDDRWQAAPNTYLDQTFLLNVPQGNWL